MRLLTRVLPVITVVLLVFSCSKSKEEALVAKVGDRGITIAAIEKSYSRVEARFLPKTLELGHCTLNHLHHRVWWHQALYLVK